jgi:VanZ family protein
VLAGFNAVLRKAAHVAEYMVFALLLWRLLERGAEARWRIRWAAATAALGVLLAGADEFHQLYTRGRAGSVVDVGWDALGVALALGWIYLRTRREESGKAPFGGLRVFAALRQGLALPRPDSEEKERR